jgi:hypothetical protein
MSFHFLLVSMISDEKLAVNLIKVYFNVISHFSL